MKKKVDKVIAKFECTSIEPNGDDGKEIKLTAVIGNDGENADFTKYTPYGEIFFGVTDKTKADELFEAGEEYYIEFTKAK